MSDEGDTEYVHNPSHNLICPICQDLFKDPVITQECNHTFCKACITAALISGPHCPICRAHVTYEYVHSNLILSAIIQELPIYCKYRNYGCNTIINLGERNLHELGCSCAPASCPHKHLGCTWRGPQNKMPSHLEVCAFEQIKGYIIRNEEQIQHLQQLIQAQAEEIQQLKKRQCLHTDAVRPPSLRSSAVLDAAPDLHSSASTSTTSTAYTSNGAEPAQDDGGGGGGGGGVGRGWRVGAVRLVDTLGGHSHGVTALAHSAAHDLLFTSSHDATIKAWHAKRGFTNLHTFLGHAYTVWAMVCHESTLYSGASEGVIKAWDMGTFECVGSVSAAHRAKIYAMKTHNNLLFTAGADRNIIIWEIKDNNLTPITTLSGHTDCVWSLAIKDNILYSASEDKTIKMWDLRTFECLDSMSHGNSKPLSIALGGDYLIAGTHDCKIKVWDQTTRQFVRSISEHTWEVWQVCVGEDYLFSGSFDHHIKVWDLRNFHLLNTLEGHKGYIHALTLGNNYLFSGSGDKTTKIWSLTG